RDAYLTQQVHDELVLKASKKADEPWDVKKPHPRYFVCIAPPDGHNNASKLRALFKQHVKPIFDAAAMDYE
ncbi:hypothetical protein HDU93_004956, partial [Gonapodya sp. JEL0774]